MPLMRDDNGNPLVVFGLGDLSPVATDRELVILPLSKRYEIGQLSAPFSDPVAKSAIENNAPLVRLAFLDIRSLDVVMHELQALRDRMAAGEDASGEESSGAADEPVETGK